MKTASQDLIREHDAILVALNVLEKMYEKMQNDENVEYNDIEEMIDFLKVFADKCHHGKEEDFLFPALEKIGIKNKNGPIGVMLEQHRQGRELIKQLKESVINQKINKSSFVVAASSYVNLLRNHIEKENTMLFPMSDEMLLAS
jgi:hemerythrin-like domain-containing protein